MELLVDLLLSGDREVAPVLLATGDSMSYSALSVFGPKPPPYTHKSQQTLVTLKSSCMGGSVSRIGNIRIGRPHVNFSTLADDLASQKSEVKPSVAMFHYD
jgi:hypothetical protein